MVRVLRESREALKAVGSEIWNFQLGYFPMYILLFITGLLAAQNKWLENIPQNFVRIWQRITLYALPTIIPLGFFFQDNPVGGMNFPAFLVHPKQPKFDIGKYFPH